MRCVCVQQQPGKAASLWSGCCLCRVLSDQKYRWMWMFNVFQSLKLGLFSLMGFYFPPSLHTVIFCIRIFFQARTVLGSKSQPCLSDLKWYLVLCLAKGLCLYWSGKSKCTAACGSFLEHWNGIWEMLF